MTDTLKLQPSSTLGSRQFKTNQEKFDRMGTLDDRKRQRVVDRVGEDKRGYHSEDSDDDGMHDDADVVDEEAEPKAGSSQPSAIASEKAPITADTLPSRTQAASTSVSAPVKSVSGPIEVGSGLKRGEDGQVVAPTIVKRKRKPVQRVSSSITR